MRLLADENVKSRLIQWLKVSGHKIKSVDRGTTDSHVFELSKTMRRVLLTGDTNFLNTAIFPPKDTPGRIVIRAFPPTLENQKTSLERILSQFNTKDCRGKLITAFNTEFRVETK